MARRIIAAVLIILASLLAPFAIGGLWAERTITETDTFVETLAPLADEPAVQQAVATEVSTALIDAIDAQARVTAALAQIQGPLADVRPDDAVIAGAIASGINGAIESGVTSYTQSDRFGDAWLAVATALQQQFVRLIERDTSTAAVTLEEGQIVLDTKVAVEKVTARLAERGVPFVDSLEVPGREVVLADAPNLQLAADALAIFLPVATWLWVVVLLMFVVGVLLWRPRSRGVLWAGLGLALGGAVTYAALDLGQAQIVAAAPSDFQGVVSEVTVTMLRFLVNALLVMVSVGLVMMLAGWLAGATVSGRKVRTMIADAAHRWGSPLADGPVGRFTSEHPMLVPTLRGLVLVIAVGFLIAAERLSPSMVLWTGVATAVALLLVEVVEGSGLSREQAHHGALVAPALPTPPDDPTTDVAATTEVAPASDPANAPTAG